MKHGIFRLWGMPIGEFFDLEALSQFCAESKRYSFFFSSWPLNVYVTPPANHAAYSYVMRPFVLKLGRGCESSERIGECDLSLGLAHSIHANCCRRYFDGTSHYRSEALSSGGLESRSISAVSHHVFFTLRANLNPVLLWSWLVSVDLNNRSCFAQF